jgi:hypothetical protein
MRACDAVLAALAANLEAIPGPAFERNQAVKTKVPAGGLNILWDGSGELEEYVIGAPLPYLWSWQAKLQVTVEHHDADQRDALFAANVEAVGDALKADRTLGGLCDWVDAVPPDITETAIEGAAAFKGGEITITISFASDNPTG